MILILSNKWDITVDFVIRELRTRGVEFLRINTEDLTQDGIIVRYPGPSIAVGKGTQTFDLSRVTTIWCRRPGKPFDFVSKEQKPSDAVLKFANDQWYAALEALELLKDVFWVNAPAASSRMESKLRQLQLASELGFDIPRTLVSNRGDQIRVFCEAEGGRVVAKALYSPLIEEPEQDFFVFSNVVTSADLWDDNALSVAPSIFQQALSPKVDYRVTVIGDTVVPVRITLSEDDRAKGTLDWRTLETNVRFGASSLPNPIEKLCRDYVRRADLIFGAIDLVEHEGKFYFLEINPNGEWGWLEKTAGVPISSALCDVLISRLQ